MPRSLHIKSVTLSSIPLNEGFVGMVVVATAEHPSASSISSVPHLSYNIGILTRPIDFVIHNHDKPCPTSLSQKPVIKPVIKPAHNKCPLPTGRNALLPQASLALLKLWFRTTAPGGRRSLSVTNCSVASLVSAHRQGNYLRCSLQVSWGNVGRLLFGDASAKWDGTCAVRLNTVGEPYRPRREELCKWVL